MSVTARPSSSTAVIGDGVPGRAGGGHDARVLGCAGADERLDVDLARARVAEVEVARGVRRAGARQRQRRLGEHREQRRALGRRRGDVPRRAEALARRAAR